MAGCWLMVRLFHIFLGALLVLNSALFWDRAEGDGEKTLLGGIGTLGGGAVVYHGYRILYPGSVCS